MIVVQGDDLYLSGEYGRLVAEAGCVINELAKQLDENLVVNYEVALQIIISAIYGGCMTKYEREKKENSTREE